MPIDRKTLIFIVVGLGALLSWQQLSRAASEIAVLRTIGVNHEDHFATLWVVDSGPHLWIRAENRQRRWLGHLRANPNVELRRNGRTIEYHARPFDTAEARAYVDRLFREKYGIADRARAIVENRDTLPIRLEPR